MYSCSKVYGSCNWQYSLCIIQNHVAGYGLLVCHSNHLRTFLFFYFLTNWEWRYKLCRSCAILQKPAHMQYIECKRYYWFDIKILGSLQSTIWFAMGIISKKEVLKNCFKFLVRVYGSILLLFNSHLQFVS